MRFMKKKELKSKIRVMTYNVHSCRGLDGKVSPERICQVIEKYSPDIVALQELDVNRKSSRNIDQPSYIAEYLRMHCHFQPAITLEGEHYGISFLSQHPFNIVKAERLAGLSGEGFFLKHIPALKYFYESREMIWANIKIGPHVINFFTTHLGLRVNERTLQAEDILSAKWTQGLNENIPTILCGDFNAGPRSATYKMLRTEFKEAKLILKNNKKTFFSYYPLFEVDHIFYRGNIELNAVDIPSTKLTRIASDHLPLIADFQL